MAIGRRCKARQHEMFVATNRISALGNPFYRALDQLLEANGFDEFAEEVCREFYAEKRGRPSIPPRMYFRMLMVGYLERFDDGSGYQDWLEQVARSALVLPPWKESHVAGILHRQQTEIRTSSRNFE